MRRSDVMRDAVDPRPKGATAIEQLKTSPKLKMNFLKEITPLLRVGLVAADEAPNHGPAPNDGLLIHRVLLAAVHSSSILPSIGNSPRIGPVSYIHIQPYWTKYGNIPESTPQGWARVLGPITENTLLCPDSASSIPCPLLDRPVIHCWRFLSLRAAAFRYS